MAFKIGCDCEWLAERFCECKKLVLSKKEADLFEEQLMHPPKPNEKLKHAAAEYLRAIKEGRLVVKD